MVYEIGEGVAWFEFFEPRARFAGIAYEEVDGSDFVANSISASLEVFLRCDVADKRNHDPVDNCQDFVTSAAPDQGVPTLDISQPSLVASQYVCQ